MDGLIKVGKIEDFQSIDSGDLIKVENPNFLAELHAERAQQSLRTVQGMDPDVEARRIGLSKKTGYPWALVREREEAVKEQAELIDLRNYRTYGQKTAQFFHNLENAAISKDDYKALSNLEHTSNSLKPELTIGRVLGRFWNDFKKSLSDRAAGNVAASEKFDPANREDVLRYLHMLNSVEKSETYKLVSQYRSDGYSQEEAEAKAMSERLDYHREYWEKIRDLEALEESEEYKGKSLGFIEDVAGGIGGSVIGIATTAANPFIGITDIYQQMYGAKAEELKEAGVDPLLAADAAQLSATGQTPLEFAGNLIGLKFLKKAFKPGSAKEFLITLLEAAAAEGFEEYIQTFPDEYANIVAANPDATEEELIHEFVDKFPDIATSEEARYSAAIGATIGALFPTAGRVTGGTLNLIDRQIETAQFNQKLDRLIEAVEYTKTKERAPEKAKEFLDHIGTSETAYITPDGVQLLFQSDPIEGQQLLDKIADTPEYAQQAITEGHDVKIDTGKFLAFLTPEQQELIKPDLKPAPSAPSIREIENTDLSEELAKDEDYYAEVIEAEKTFRDELNRLNKQVVESGYSKQYADDFIQIVERFADRMGLEGLDKKAFIGKIVIQKRDQAVDSDGIRYNQDGQIITDSKAFKKWFGDSKIVDKKGKPLVVFHGSGAKNINVFDPAKAGEIQTSDWGRGVYFTPSEFTADYYRQSAATVLDKETKRLWAEFEEKASELGTTPMNAAIDLGFGSEQYNELEKYAERYRARVREVEQSEAGKVYPVYISMKNPFYYAPQEVTDPYLAEHAQTKGHDGIIITYRDGTGIDEIVVFEPNQIKSVYNQGTFDIADPNIFLQVKKPPKIKEFFQRAGETVGLGKTKEEKIYYQDGTLNTESDAFKTWAEGAELIEGPQGHEFEPDKPIIAKMWHGTTHEFEVVNADLSNPENYFGKGFYSSTSRYDVEQNYEGVGPDLTSRLEQEKERISQDLEQNRYSHSSELSEETLEKLENNEISIDEAAEEIAHKRLIGEHGEGGAALELYVKLKNPIILTPDGGTRVEGGPDMDYYKDIAENEIDKEDYIDDDGDFDEDSYNDDLEEKAREIYYEDYNPEEIGNLSLLREGIVDAAKDFDADGHQIWAELQEQLGLYDDSYLPAQEVFDILRKLESVMYIEDHENGGLANTEFLRKVVQNMGYDGIIMNADHANQEWNMNIPGGTWHFINWEPNNIKSVENTCEFSLTDDSIYRQDQKRASVQILDEKYLVSLFEGKKDLSSLVHETGHIFLNELHQLASTGNATDQLKLDYESVRKWLKLKPGQQFEKEHHEQFAKGFEVYLLEGKAPTTDLIPVFQRFKNWLMSVYQSVRDLGVELDDEIRGVFDRMFTSRQEIYRSAQQNNMQMLTKDEMDALGVVADDRIYLERLHRKALDDAEGALHRDRNRNRRSLVKLWREMAGKQFDDDPVNQLVKTLSEGSGISRTDLEETFGSEMADILTRKRVPPIIKSDGISVNEATVLGGYHNPDDMIRVLMNIQKKESFVKAYIENEEIEHDAKYNVDDYIASTEAFSDFLEIKNKYLKRSQGLPTEIKPWRAFKAYAKQSLDAKPARDAIAQHIYMGAHARYSNQEKSKISQGKLGEAAIANEYARLNYEMSKQAIKNRKFMERAENRVKRLLNSKTIHPDAQYQIIDLAARFGLVPRRTGENLEKTLERLRESIPTEDRISLNDWVEKKIKNGYEIELPDFVLNPTVRNYKDLKFSDFEQLAEAFQILKAVDQQERYYNALGESIALDQVVDELEQEMLSTMTPKTLETISPNAAKAALSNFNAIHTKMEFLLRKLDGGEGTGTWWNYLFKPIADAEAAREDRLKEVRKKLTSKELFGRFSGYDLEGIFHKPIFTDGMPIKMTKNQILATALNVGTLDNRTKLQEGYGWTDEQLEAILDNLTEEDWQFVQNVWDYINTFKEDSFAVAKEMTGKRPEEVKAAPVQTKFGELEGGYYPLVYDSKLTFSSFLHEQATDIQGLFRKAHASANTRPKSHHARQASAGGQKPKLDVSVISDHIFEVVHDITHRKAVVNVSKLLRNRRLQKSLTSTIGIDMQKQMVDWLHDVAQEKAHPSDTFHKLLRWARTGTTVMNMGLKATTMVTQFVGYTQTIDELGIKQAAKGLNMFYGGGSDYSKIGERIQFVMEKSGFMRNRINSHDRDIRDALKNIAPGAKFQAKVQRFSFLGIGLFQMGVDLPTWYGAYDSAYNKFNDLPADKIDQKAVDYADSVVRMTQGAGGTKDLAKIQRGDETMRLFTMFYGYFNTLYNLASIRISSVKKVKDVGALAASALWLWFLPALLAESVAGRGPEQDEEWSEWALPILAMHPFQTVVGVRDMTNYAFGSFGYQITPAQAAPKEIMDFLNIGKAIEEDNDKKATVQAAETLGYVAKLPMKQLIITLGNIYDYATGRDPDFEIRDLFYRKQKHRR